uniref:Uncharacterized protein n=1 Tax=Anopheles atroparvus TaxID=41427 RepID=A0A182ILX0_ANOAO
MFSVGAVVLGVFWVTAGADAFLPLLTNVYMNGPGRAGGSAMSARAPQTVCSWYNVPRYAGNNGGGSLWVNGMGNAGNNGWSNAGNIGWGNAGSPNSLPGLMALLGSVYSSSITGSSGQAGRPGFAVRVEETIPRGSGGGLSNAPLPANAAGTRELDYYDQDAQYYYDDDYEYYGQDYTYSDSVEYADTVVFSLPQNEAPPTIVELLQTIYGSQFGTASGGSNPCGACAASMLNMLMG